MTLGFSRFDNTSGTFAPAALKARLKISNTAKRRIIPQKPLDTSCLTLLNENVGNRRRKQKKKNKNKNKKAARRRTSSSWTRRDLINSGGVLLSLLMALFGNGWLLRTPPSTVSVITSRQPTNGVPTASVRRAKRRGSDLSLFLGS